MTKIIMMFLAFLLILPVLPWVPLGISLKGKLILAAESFLAAGMLLMLGAYLPLWQSTLIALLLLMTFGYFTLKYGLPQWETAGVLAAEENRPEENSGKKKEKGRKLKKQKETDERLPFEEEKSAPVPSNSSLMASGEIVLPDDSAPAGQSELDAKPPVRETEQPANETDELDELDELDGLAWPGTDGEPEKTSELELEELADLPELEELLAAPHMEEEQQSEDSGETEELDEEDWLELRNVEELSAAEEEKQSEEAVEEQEETNYLTELFAEESAARGKERESLFLPAAENEPAEKEAEAEEEPSAVEQGDFEEREEISPFPAAENGAAEREAEAGEESSAVEEGDSEEREEISPFPAAENGAAEREAEAGEEPSAVEEGDSEEREELPSLPAEESESAGSEEEKSNNSAEEKPGELEESELLLLNKQGEESDERKETEEKTEQPDGQELEQAPAAAYGRLSADWIGLIRKEIELKQQVLPYAEAEQVILGYLRAPLHDRDYYVIARMLLGFYAANEEILQALLLADELKKRLHAYPAVVEEIDSIKEMLRNQTMETGG